MNQYPHVRPFQDALSLYVVLKAYSLLSKVNTLNKQADQHLLPYVQASRFPHGSLKRFGSSKVVGCTRHQLKPLEGHLPENHYSLGQGNLGVPIGSKVQALGFKPPLVDNKTQCYVTHLWLDLEHAHHTKHVFIVNVGYLSF